jgi:hypothetical protein
MRVDSIFSAGLLAVAVWTASEAACAQFVAPQNSLSFEDKGTLEAIQGEAMQMRDSKSEPWLLSIGADTKVTVEGEAERDCLRPGLFVQFTAKINKKGRLEEPLSEIEITSAQGKASMGIFPADDVEGLKPVRALTAGSYLVKGKLATFRDDELLVIAGRHRISGAVSADDLKVKLNLEDTSLAQPGDEVKVKAWYYDTGRPNLNLARRGNAMAEEITITLAKPLESGGKKPRQTERPARASSKSKVSK